MRKLVVLVLALLLSGAACGPSVNDRHLMGNGGRAQSTAGGDRTSLRLEKMSDAALGTHAAIENAANNRGTIKNAAQLGFKLASAAATPSVSHTAQMGLEGGRRLTANTGYRDDVGSLDTAMATSAAIAKVVNTPTKGAATYATDAGHDAAHVGTGAHPHTALMTDQAMGGRRLAGNYRDDVGGLDASMAASAAIAKAVKTPNMGGAKYATDAGIATGRVASGAHRHTGWDVDMATGGRRLHSNRDRSGVGSLDATLAASDAISKAVKTPSMGSAKFATDAGIKTQRVGAMAHTGWEADLAGGVRRLVSNRDRSGVGSLDATLAASDAISKAVKTPSLGSAKFATDTGVKTQRVGGMAHSSWEVDSASGGRRMLSNRDRSGVGSLDATLAAADAISKAVKTPSMGSAKFATDAGVKTQRVGGMAHSSFETDMASGGRRLVSNRDRTGVGSLDATLAAADAINKAVKTPSMGSAKFATDAGIKTQRVGGMAHTGFETDMAIGGRRLLGILRL